MAAVALAGTAVLSAPPARAPARERAGAAPSAIAPFRPATVLLGFRAGAAARRQAALERAVGALAVRRIGPVLGGADHGLPVPLELHLGSELVSQAVARLRRSGAVAYAEPDYLMVASAVPNDHFFGLQWAFANTGQSMPVQDVEEKLRAAEKGTRRDDDGALLAWDVSTGSRSIVIGEADTGVDYAHPDLAGNVWSNPGAVGGCAAGTHGFDVLNGSCDPMDDDIEDGGHGTHVAGIMGAEGNNRIGVAGVNWRTSILPVKWLSSAATGSTSDLIGALQWLLRAKQQGVNLRVVNDSATFYGTPFSQALSDEIDALGASGILFVTAAGNSSTNNDEAATPRYPCDYDRPTEICVTAADRNYGLPGWANYGARTVDLAAPGVNIYSTLRGGSYGYLTGTSMASAEVAGAAALILSARPSLSPQALKADILGNVRPAPAFAGRVASGGVLDVCRAMPGCVSRALSVRREGARWALDGRVPFPGARVLVTVYRTLGGRAEALSQGRFRRMAPARTLSSFTAAAVRGVHWSLRLPRPHPGSYTITARMRGGSGRVATVTRTLRLA